MLGVWNKTAIKGSIDNSTTARNNLNNYIKRLVDFLVALAVTENSQALESRPPTGPRSSGLSGIHKDIRLSACSQIE